MGICVPMCVMVVDTFNQTAKHPNHNSTVKITCHKWYFGCTLMPATCAPAVLWFGFRTDLTVDSRVTIKQLIHVFSSQILRFHETRDIQYDSQFLLIGDNFVKKGKGFLFFNSSTILVTLVSSSTVGGRAPSGTIFYVVFAKLPEIQELSWREVVSVFVLCHFCFV